jgi:hypothetical protein
MCTVQGVQQGAQDVRWSVAQVCTRSAHVAKGDVHKRGGQLRVEPLHNSEHGEYLCPGTEGTDYGGTGGTCFSPVAGTREWCGVFQFGRNWLRRQENGNPVWEAE